MVSPSGHVPKHPQNGNEAARPDKILRELCTFSYFPSVSKLLFICSYRHLSDTDGIFLHSPGCQIPWYPLKAMHYFSPFPPHYMPWGKDWDVEKM